MLCRLGLHRWSVYMFEFPAFYSFCIRCSKGKLEHVTQAM